MPSTPCAPLGTSVTLLPSGSASAGARGEPLARDLEAHDARRRQAPAAPRAHGSSSGSSRSCDGGAAACRRPACPCGRRAGPPSAARRRAARRACRRTGRDRGAAWRGSWRECSPKPSLNRLGESQFSASTAPKQLIQTPPQLRPDAVARRAAGKGSAAGERPPTTWEGTPMHSRHDRHGSRACGICRPGTLGRRQHRPGRLLHADRRLYAAAARGGGARAQRADAAGSRDRHVYRAARRQASSTRRR